MTFLKSRQFLIMLYLAFLLLLLFAAAWFYLAAARDQNRMSASATSADNTEDTSLEGTADMAYYVREYGKQIAVFDMQGNLAFVADVYLVSLPAADREMLQKGIFVRDAQSLMALIEDYTG